MSLNFDKLIVPTRRDETTVKDRNLVEELASDRARILYSAPFRRLTQKTQVFPLENNASIRNRAIHSLEVSDVGRWIAYYITRELIESGSLNPSFQLPIMNAVENACLLHDIGNPPFGHFGEEAIKKWFSDQGEDICASACSGIHDRHVFDNLIKDFTNFDGNPQGLRIILRLQTDLDQFSMNLTYTTILSFIKYVTSSSKIEPNGTNPLKKKAGFFESEKNIIKEIKDSLDISEDSRHPLTYIMEAADDISYCISDIEDGIEKNIISVDDFFSDLLEEWERVSEGQPFPFCVIPDLHEQLGVKKFLEFKTSYVRGAIQKAATSFVEKQDHLLNGSIFNLFHKDDDEYKAIDVLKSVARKRLYSSSFAENPELAGHQIVTGLLDSFMPLMKINKNSFNNLIESKKLPSKRYGKGLDLHWRLFNKLPEKHFNAYEYQVKEFAENDNQGLYEWFSRVHFILDHISGMTDTFALGQYQLLKGIRLS